MWYEYPIPANFELQKRIIRQLREWIQGLEKRGLVAGYAFNHYSRGSRAPESPDEICIRFNYPNEENREAVKKELVNEVKQLVPDYDLKEGKWESKSEGELEAYEFGSRCTFLFCELVEKGRFKEDYIFDFFPPRAETRIPLVFQQCFNHGVMNSLGISKNPNEQIIHLILLMESTGSNNIKKLFKQIHIDPNLSQLRLQTRPPSKQ